MAEEQKCQQCGAELPPNAPGGVCPKCIMRLGLPTGVDPGDSPAQDDQNAVPTSATPPGGFVPPEPEELGEKLPGLEIFELLGHGGMGAVYKARQKQLDRIVALKILPLEVGKDPAFAERFAREARSLAKLNHPHIVTVYEFGQSDDLYYFIMEFVDGTDLRQVIRTRQLAADQALMIVPQICEALQYAHEEGVVHRDIKPENILLDRRGRVKIGDFGLAKLLDRPATAYTLTQPQQRMGTPQYMAPEQIEGASRVDHRADIYSLGVVFYEMLTGELPIGRFAPPSRKVQVDVRLDEIVLHTLEKEPERRYQRASEVKTDIEQMSERRQPVPEPQLSETAHFSRKAIAGIACTPFSILLLGMLSTHEGKRAFFKELFAPPGENWGRWFFIFVVTFLGIACAIATTVLGAVSIDEIRRSRGRLTGLWLALVDTLLLPLFVLDFAVFVLFCSNKVPWNDPRLFPVSLVVCAVLDLLVVRWAWRKASERVRRHSKARGYQDIDADATGRNSEAIEAARRRLRIPAVGLFLTGVMSCILPAILLGFTGQRQFGSLVGFIAVGFIFGTGLIIVAGAWAMTRLQSYGIAVAGSIVAMFSATFLLGLPMGIWAIVVLSSTDVQAAFAANKKLPVGAAKRWNPAPVIATIGIVAIPLALLAPVAITMWIAPGSREFHRPSPITILRGIFDSESEASAEKIGDQDFPSGTADYIESGPAGPTLSQQCVETLDLKPSEVHAVNEILRNAHKEYSELEARNTTRQRTGDHLQVTIAPFRKEALAFLEKLWADLDKALDTRKRAVARRHLPLRKMFGALEFGQPTVVIKINKDGSFFDYDLKYQWPEGSGRIGGGGTGRTNKLDPEYQRLWDQSTGE